MDEKLRQQQRAYDLTWEVGLEKGKEQRGNLNVNIDFLKSLDLVEEGVKVLELGCGIGTIVYELTKLGCLAIGTDISNKAVEYGVKKYPGVNLKVGAAENLAFKDKSFDIVMSFDVFEHINEVDRHLDEVSRVLNDGGCYLLQTPNKYFNAIFETMKSKSFEWRKYHPSLHTARQLEKRFAKHGFKVEFMKMNTVNEFSLNKLKNSWLRGVVGKIDFKKMPLCMQTNFYIIAKKVE